MNTNELDDRINAPITPGLIREILLNGVLVKDDVAPALNAPALYVMASHCIALRHHTRGWNGRWQAALDTHKKIVASIEFLRSALSPLRDESEKDLVLLQSALGADGLTKEDIEAFERFIKNDTSDLHAFDSFLSAMETFCERGLPRHGVAALNPVIKKRADFDLNLHLCFQKLFPAYGVLAGHRFIAAIAPYITGEIGTAEAVRKNIARVTVKVAKAKSRPAEPVDWAAEYEASRNTYNQADGGTYHQADGGRDIP